jgi:hypothetical protein
LCRTETNNLFLLYSLLQYVENLSGSYNGDAAVASWLEFEYF